jgi:hypothetical protein
MSADYACSPAAESITGSTGSKIHPVVELPLSNFPREETNFMNREALEIRELSLEASGFKLMGR